MNFFWIFGIFYTFFGFLNFSLFIRVYKKTCAAGHHGHRGHSWPHHWGPKNHTNIHSLCLFQARVPPPTHMNTAVNTHSACTSTILTLGSALFSSCLQTFLSAQLCMRCAKTSSTEPNQLTIIPGVCTSTFAFTWALRKIPRLLLLIFLTSFLDITLQTPLLLSPSPVPSLWLPSR